MSARISRFGRAGTVPLLAFVLIAGARFRIAAVELDQEVAIDIRDMSNGLLTRPARLDVNGVSLERALTALRHQAGVPIAFSVNFLPPKKVTCRCEDSNVGEALDRLLEGTGLTYAELRTQVLIEPYDSAPRIWYRDGEMPGRLVSMPHGIERSLVRTVTSFLLRSQEGSVSGIVVDAGTQSPIEDAQVIVVGTNRGVVTDAAGRFQIDDLSGTEVTLRVERIGFRTVSRAVPVGAMDVRFELEESAIALDEVVVTGTMVPTEVKALPTPVTIISTRELEAQRPHTMRELYRQLVPTGVAWDMPSSPTQTIFSVRGTSRIGGGGGGQMKVFIDGVPVADNTGATVDPNIIERIEVVRGPQAAAIYGSDALSGVVQIFTKRGKPGAERPEVNVEAAAGLIQTPYDGYEEVVRQSYKASVLGGGDEFSYAFGGSYTRTPDWVGPVTAQSKPSVHGGVRFTRGIFNADVSARYHEQNYGQSIDPSLASTGFLSVTKPFYQPIKNTLETMSVRLGLDVRPWWTHRLTLGVDRRGGGYESERPRLTTPADTFLSVYASDESRRFIDYATTLQGSLGENATASLVVGADHYHHVSEYWIARGATRTEGSITSATPISASRVLTDNTGYYAQAQVGIHDQLFITAGIRAEQNTHFGDSLDVPLSPRVGVAYARDVGGATAKLRASWGRAIRPPSPGYKLGSESATSRTLPNPQIGPERQQGWDAGVDIVLGARASLGITYYDQTAFDLIQHVVLDVGQAGITEGQYQNVGKVSNSGVEIEATANVGPIGIRANYGYQKSRILDLGPNYSGDLMVGDEPSLSIPSHTAGAALNANLRPGTGISAGITYVGSFQLYDIRAAYSCFGGTGPCREGPGLRNYWTTDPGWTKINLTVTQDVAEHWSGFLSIDNVTNSFGHEFTQFVPVMGRITTLGVQFRY